LNTDPANCGSCGGACVAPANGTVTGCANGVCQTACNTGYDKVGNQCSLIRFYIDATSGDDNALGTEAAPFKTWKKAATRTSVVTNPQIYFKTGVFDATAPGEDFTTKIPDGATVLTSGGKVTLTGNGGIGLPFAGSGTVNGGSTVDGLLLQTFSEPFSTTTGTQTLSYVTLKDIQTPMSVSSTSVTVDNFAMDSIPGSGVFTVQFGKLTLSNGTLSTRVALCLTGGPTPSTTNGSGSVVMTNVDLTGQLYLGIGSVGNALTNVRMSATCGGQNRALSVDGSASITLTNCSSTSPIDFVSAAVTSRGTTYSGVVSLTGPGPSPYDFGTAASKGNNTFNYGLKVIGDNVVANASGNKWIPSDGPADASGNISPQTLTGPYSNGMNVSIDSALSSVVF
jgi:hypothetical protein